MTLDTDKQTLDFYLQAIESKKSKNFTLAIELFTKAIQDNLKYPDLYAQRSICFMERKQYARAVDDLNQAIQRETKDFLLFYNRGWNYLKLNKYDLAIQDFSNSLLLNPEYPSSYFNRGLLYLLLEKYEEAISDFSNAIQIESKHFKAYFQRGLAQEKKGNINQALQDLNTSVAINPDYVKAREERAKLLVETGNSESALTDYEEILKLSPANISVEQKRNLVKKQVQEILSDSDKPDYSKLFYMSGLAKISMGNYQGAVEDYTNAIRIDPNNSNAYYYRSLAKIALSKDNHHYLREAFEDQSKSLQLNPEDTKTLYFKTITEQTIHKTKSFQIPALQESKEWIECYGVSYPALELGGDYFYIYKEENEDNISLTLGDVEGKGAGAAMFMSISLQLLDQARKTTKTPAQVMNHVNSQFIGLTGGKFKDRKRKKKPPIVTAIYAYLQKDEAGKVSVDLVNAGHLYPLLLKGSEIIEIKPDNGNPPLNAEDILIFHSNTYPIQRGDRIFIYSDGLIEENAGSEDRQFGLDKVKDWLYENRNLEIKDQVEKLIRYVQKFGEINGQEDDITLVGLRVL